MTACQLIVYLRLIAHQYESGFGIAGEMFEHRGHRYVRAMVATHAIDGNGYIHREASTFKRPLLFSSGCGRCCQRVRGSFSTRLLS
jgi:hypothetical protein